MENSVIQFRGTIYENGYGLIASKVMRDKTIPKQSRLIYAYMCSFAGMDKEGNRVAFPSVSLQCEELDMSEDTYYKWRKELEKRGLITIEKRKDGGKFERNLYFIEAVPVPQNEEIPPYPKNSGTENSGTENLGTINNSFNNNSFNNDIKTDDDKKRTESSPSHNEENIDLTISNLREATKEELTDRSFNAVVRRVVDKHKQGKVNSFRDYLVTALSNKIEELELRKIKDKEQKKALESIRQETATRLMNVEHQRPVPFYNWLVERD